MVKISIPMECHRLKKVKLYNRCYASRSKAGLGPDLRKPRRSTIGRALQMGRDKRFLDTAQNQLAAAGFGDEPQTQPEENVPPGRNSRRSSNNK